MVHMSVLALVDTLGVRTWENNFFSLCENDHYKGPLCGRGRPPIDILKCLQGLAAALLRPQADRALPHCADF